MYDFINKNRWTTLVAGSLATFVSMFPAVWSIFQRAASEAYGITLTQSANVFSFTIAFYGLFCLIGGKLQEMFPPRLVFMVGAVIMSLSFMSLYLIRGTVSPVVIYALHSFLFGFGCGINNPAFTTPMLRWYADKNGFAIGVTYAVSRAMLVGETYIGNWLLSSFGIHRAMLIIGIVTMAVMVLCAPTVINPSDEYIRRMVAKANAQSSGSSAARGTVDFSTGEMLRTVQYYLMLFCGIFATPAYLLMASSIVTFGQTRGLSENAAVTAVAIATAGSAFAKFFVPSVSDKVGRKKSALVILTIMLVSAVLLWKSRGLAVVITYAFLYSAYDGFYSLVPPITNDMFGFRYSGSNVAFVSLFNTIASFATPFRFTVLHSRFGDDTVHYIGIVTCALALVCMALLKTDTSHLKIADDI